MYIYQVMAMAKGQYKYRQKLIRNFLKNTKIWTVICPLTLVHYNRSWLKISFWYGHKGGLRLFLTKYNGTLLRQHNDYLMGQLSNYRVSQHSKKSINTSCLKQIKIFVIYAIFTVRQNVFSRLNTLLFISLQIMTKTEPQP